VFRRSLDFIKEKLSARQFIIVSGIIVGIASGLAAVALKYFVHSLQEVVRHSTEGSSFPWAFALIPIIGITLAWLYTKIIHRSTLRKGSAEVVYSLLRNSGNLPVREVPGQLVTSGLTVGFGGSVGLESPMVSSGSAIGSNYAQALNLSYREKTVLIGCGAAAGIAAAFNAPIAGVLFAIEVILMDVSAGAFIPLIIAAASGALIAKIILKEGILLNFFLQSPFNYENVPFYLLLGILIGLACLAYTRLFSYIEKRILSIQSQVLRIVVGGLFLSLLIAMFPSLYGEGYDSIKLLANLQPFELFKQSAISPFIQDELVLLCLIGGLVLIKAVAAALTIGSGGNGGNFGPSLFAGSYLGFAFSRAVNILGIGNIPETNFTIVAMAGFLSGIFYAPLTAIFLIAELTGGYGLMIPLMIVASLSLMIVHLGSPISPEARRLSEKLKFNISSKDDLLISRLDFTSLIEKNFRALDPNDSLGSLVSAVKHSSRNTFPVVNGEGKLVGVVHLDSIRQIIFDQARYDDIQVKDLMTEPAAVVDVRETMDKALGKFEQTRQWNLPVVEGEQYLGFLSKSSILNAYRKEVLHTS